MAYWSIEPPLGDRIEIGLAQLMALTANMNRDSKQSKRGPFTADEFLPRWWKEPEREPEPDEDGMAPDKVMAVLEGMMARQEMRKQIERRK